VNKSPKVTATLFLAALLFSCSSPTKPKPPVTPKTGFTISATVDNTTAFSSSAVITIAPDPFDASKRALEIKGTSASGYSVDLSFFSPSNVTAPVTLGPSAPGYAQCKYYEGVVGSNTVWLSGDTITVTVNSFSVGATDTSLSVDFSFAAWGGAPGSVLSVHNFTGGTLRRQ
jgi:hypothetical protein